MLQGGDTDFPIFCQVPDFNMIEYYPDWIHMMNTKRIYRTNIGQPLQKKRSLLDIDTIRFDPIIEPAGQVGSYYASRLRSVIKGFNSTPKDPKYFKYHFLLKTTGGITQVHPLSTYFSHKNQIRIAVVHNNTLAKIECKALIRILSFFKKAKIFKASYYHQFWRPSSADLNSKETNFDTIWNSIIQEDSDLDIHTLKELLFSLFTGKNAQNVRNLKRDYINGLDNRPDDKDAQNRL